MFSIKVVVYVLWVTQNMIRQQYVMELAQIHTTK